MKRRAARIAKALKPITSVPQAPAVARTEDHPEVKRVDKQRLDAATLAMYEESVQAAEALAAHEAANGDGVAKVAFSKPFQFGFVTTLGVLAAIGFGALLGNASTVIVYVVGALFVALGLDPIVRRLERRGLKRGWAIAAVFLALIACLVALFSIVIPVLVEQITLLVQSAPGLLNSLAQEQWYKDISDRTESFVNFDALLENAREFASDQRNWFSVAGGVLQVVNSVASTIMALVIVLILSLYFLASLRAIKRGFYTLAPLSKRARVIDITEQVADSVGGYITGQATIAVINAVLGFIAMSIIGVPFAAVLAVCVFFLALIPLIGALCATVLVTAVALFASPMTALAIGIYYLVYMQLEAYVLTPRIMNKAVSVPGAFVVIGALTGGALFGLLGALIAIPVTASVLMIVKQVWIPHQDSR